MEMINFIYWFQTKYVISDNSTFCKTAWDSFQLLYLHRFKFFNLLLVLVVSAVFAVCFPHRSLPIFRYLRLFSIFYAICWLTIRDLLLLFLASSPNILSCMLNHFCQIYYQNYQLYIALLLVFAYFFKLFFLSLINLLHLLCSLPMYHIFGFPFSKPLSNVRFWSLSYFLLVFFCFFNIFVCELVIVQVSFQFSAVNNNTLVSSAALFLINFCISFVCVRSVSMNIFIFHIFIYPNRFLGKVY